MNKSVVKVCKIGISFSTVFLTLISCSQSTPITTPLANNISNSEIINGTLPAANSQEALATVAIYLPIGTGANNLNPIKNFCTGTLIATNVVITAAHCIIDMSDRLMTDPQTLVNDMIIGFGTKVAKDQNEAGFQYRTVKSFKVHDKYTLDSVKKASTVPMYDIALFKLNAAAPAPALPVQVVANPNSLVKNLPIILAGFGLTGVNPSVRATDLLEVSVLVDNPSLTATQFTYQSTTGASCNGDSGGPAYVKLSTGAIALVGITSWGDPACKVMGAYTSVPAMKNWIWTTIPLL
jgi:secreted trypsin-like serine protease